MNILVTGGSGYIGSRLIPKLLGDGHVVTALDTMWFGHGYLPTDNENLFVLKGDVRDELPEGEWDAVLWLASVSNNDMYPISETTLLVNSCLQHMGKKFIYASSVAVLDPTSDYAKNKLYCEEWLHDKGAVIVRAASVVGYSSNMRFDITLNRMTHDAYKKGVITVNGGEQERTHVHIDDLCDFYRLAVEKAVNGETYTVSALSETVLESAKNVAACFAGDIVVDVKPRTDNRSYSVVTGNNMGWTPKRSVWDGVGDIISRFDSGLWKDTSDEILWRINRTI